MKNLEVRFHAIRIRWRTTQEVIELLVRTKENRDSAKPNTIGMMRVMVTTKTECR